MMQLRKWDEMPDTILVTNNSDDPILSYSKYFETAHDCNGKLSSKAKIKDIGAYKYLKEIIHNRYYDIKEDYLSDGSDNFRCKLCGFKHGAHEITAVSRFRRKNDVPEIEVIDGDIIKLPYELDMGSTCMINHEKITIRHNKLLRIRHAHINQIKWFQYAWKSPSYCYINNAWRNDNRRHMNEMTQRMRISGITRTDIYKMLKNCFYNCRGNKMPIRIYKGIGADESLSGLGNIYKYMKGRKVTKFNSCIDYHKHYIEIPSQYLWEIIKKA